MNKKQVDWISDWVKQMEMWNSDTGIEMQCCLVAQGHEAVVFVKFAELYGSHFTAEKKVFEIRRMVGK